MSKKQFVDKDGNKFVEVTPWYKKMVGMGNCSTCDLYYYLGYRWVRQ